MQKTHKKIAALLVLLLAVGLVFGFAPSFGQADEVDPLADYLAEQAKLEQQLRDQQKIINSQKAEKSNLETQVASLDVKINRLQLDLEAADIQITVAKNQLQALEKELAEAQARLDSQIAYLQGRVQDVYTQGDISLWSVALECQSFSDFLLAFDYMDIIVAQDMTLIESIDAERALIAQKVALQQQRVKDLDVLRQSKVSAINQLGDLQSQKEVAVAQINKEAAATQAYIDALEKASADIAKEIRALSSGGGEFNGVFTWPLPGYTRVSSDYGYRKHPVTGVKKSFHTGVDFPAPKGTKIVAAEGGTVIKTGWNSAYGNMVIIDHGGGVTTLYGHMSSTAVKQGASIARGDKVGGVGTTGLSTGNHLHFEVRVNGDHVNPWGYLK